MEYTISYILDVMNNVILHYKILGRIADIP